MEPRITPLKATIMQPTTLQLLHEDGRHELVSTVLRYDPADPYAVTLIAQGDESPVVWIFARDLLADGLHSPTGDGDVRVWPDQDEDGVPMIIIELIAHDASALLAADPASIRAFVTTSHELVAPGRESDHCDLDALVRAFFAEASRGGTDV